MELTDRQLSNGTIEVAVDGELDAVSAPRLRDWLLRSIELENRRTIEIDFARCTFVDAGALAVIVEAAQVIDGRLPSLRLLNLGPQPQRVLAMNGIDRLAGIEIAPAAGDRPVVATDL